MASKQQAARMGEAQAWRYIADAFARAIASKKTRDNRPCLTQSGICHAVAELSDDNLVTSNVGDNMDDRMYAHKPDGAYVYWWRLTPAGDRKRIAFCRRMARLVAPKPKRASSRVAQSKPRKAVVRGQ